MHVFKPHRHLFSPSKQTFAPMSLDAPSLLDVSSPPSASSPSPSHHLGSTGRHFYVAVDRWTFKMETLIDLLGVAGNRAGLPIALCCSSRDELDAVCAAVSSLSYISLSSLYSDLSESERAATLEKFRRVTMEWNQNFNVYPGTDDETDIPAKKSHVIVTTDACLPMLTTGELPIMSRVLINFEIPTKKETYLRRMSACLAADGIVINMVVGGEVVTLKSIEESSGFLIAEMPINISEIL